MKKILLTLSLMSVAGIGWSQCSASFIDSIVGNTVGFTNTSDSGSGITYYWYFPGGNPSADTTTSNTGTYSTYNTPGFYEACVILVNTNLSCVDTFCDTFTITPPPVYVSLSGGNTVCGTCTGSATANVWGGTTPYTYLWSDGSTTQNISSLCAGTYTVTVSDNNGTTAQNSVVIYGYGSTSNISISISDSTPCPGDTVSVTAGITGGTAPYTYQWSNGSNTNTTSVTNSTALEVTVTDANGCVTIDSLIYINFIDSFPISIPKTNESCYNCCDGTATANASGGSGSGFTYDWSNGANTASINNLCPGSYSVIATDIGTGCSVSGNTVISAFVCKSISGSLAQGAEARVYLIQENSGVLTAIDSTEVNDSINLWHFSNVCPGTYYVKAALLPAHPQYYNYLPTYYDSVALWSNATGIVMTNAYINNIDFSLIPGTNPGGPGFVGGLISQGANRGEGDPITNAQVILYNNNDEIVAFTKTDVNGEYEFDNIPLGSYSIHVDILNKVSNAWEVTLTTENAEAYGRNFTVTGNQVKPVTPTGITDVAGAGLEIFPNPTSGTLFIRQHEASVQSINIFNLVGEQVYQLSGITGTGVINIDLGDLASGQYIMELKGERSTYHQAIIID